MREVLDQISGQRHVVIGDLYLDHYVFGKPQRVSREAPVLVLDEERREDRLGGGAAPALALKALGCEVAVSGVVGDDPAGATVVRLLTDAGIDASQVAVDSSRPTTVKTRVVAEGFFLFPQQLVRVDRQERDPISPDVERSIGRAIRTVQPECVLVSDYRSGVVTDALVDHILDYRQLQGCPITVDSQGDLGRFEHFDLIKCNLAEAEAYLGHDLGSRRSRERRLAELRSNLDADCLVVTRGGEGSAVVLENEYVEIPAANRSEVFDVTGAGDTVVAIMTAALVAGASPIDAARLAQIAAGIVVRKWGNAQASRAELEDAIQELEDGGWEL
ncbi:MAG: bifunctional ADP-heptose synthase [Thermomicrobiales bacterium]